MTSKEIIRVLWFDLYGLKSAFECKNREDFDYHFKLLEGNLQDALKLSNDKLKKILDEEGDFGYES